MATRSRSSLLSTSSTVAVALTLAVGCGPRGDEPGRAPAVVHERSAPPPARPSLAPAPGESWVGVIVASRSVDVRGDLGGEVTALPVRLGQWVERGEPLVELDPWIADEDIRMRRAELESARARVDEAQLEQRGARKERDRVRRLHRDGFASRASLDDAELTLARLAAVLTRADADANQAQTALERARRQRIERTVRAPFDGVVARLHVDVGDSVSARVPLVRLLESSEPTVAFAVEHDAPRPSIGTPVTVTTLDEAKTWAATVVSVQPDADPRTGLFAVHAEIGDEDIDGCTHALAVTVRPSG